MDGYNMIGRRIYLPERPLEPPDCQQEDPAELRDEEYDRMEDELSGRTYRT